MKLDPRQALFGEAPGMTLTLKPGKLNCVETLIGQLLDSLLDALMLHYPIAQFGAATIVVICIYVQVQKSSSN